MKERRSQAYSKIHSKDGFFHLSPDEEASFIVILSMEGVAGSTWGKLFFLRGNKEVLWMWMKTKQTSVFGHVSRSFSIWFMRKQRLVSVNAPSFLVYCSHLLLLFRGNLELCIAFD